MLRFDHIVPPPVAFYFNVTFEGLIETSFQEVSGLQLEMETETMVIIYYFTLSLK